MLQRFALSCYKEIIAVKLEYVMEVGTSILLPRFTEDFVSQIVKSTQKILMLQKPIIYLTGPYVVVGDIHGNFHDLIRIFANNGYPPNKRYVFLGDYVDRGTMSFDVILFLFILKLNFPNDIILLRGNHEFEDINSKYGFLDNIMHEYKQDRLWKEFNEAFQYLTIGAFIGTEIFCVHGGISDRVNKAAIEGLTFPLVNSHIIEDMTWSDPCDHVQCRSNCVRGKGSLFGYKALNTFMNDTGVKLIIRGHQCVNGYEFALHRCVLTLFSSSNYGNLNNKCGYAIINENYTVDCFKLIPLNTPINPDDMVYYNVKYCEESPQKYPLIMLTRVGSIPVRRTLQRPRHDSISKAARTSLIQLSKIKPVQSSLRNISSPVF